VPDEPVLGDTAGLRAVNARVRQAVASQSEEIEGLRAERDADRELIRRLGLRLAELERRLSMDSTDSGIPASKERIGAQEARKARQQSEREGRKDGKPGGQPGHQGKGLKRNPDPDDTQAVSPHCGVPFLSCLPGRRVPGGRAVGAVR
jgi:transposase